VGAWERGCDLSKEGEEMRGEDILMYLSRHAAVYPDSSQGVNRSEYSTQD
jgi:hypothetical protein